MNPNIKSALRVLALVLYAFATIITCAAVWNAGIGTFPALAAAAVFAVNGYIVYLKCRKLRNQ